MKRIILVVTLLAFTGYSLMVVVQHGYLGFLTLASREPWAMQMLLDLTIFLCLVGTWLRQDARAQGIPALPYLLSLPLLGSIGALAYLVHRSVKAPLAGQARPEDAGVPAPPPGDAARW